MAPIHPRLLEYLAPLQKERYFPGDLPLPEARERFNAQMAPKPEGMRTEDRQLDDFTVRLYFPEGEGPHPVSLFFHGGGMVFGSTDTSDALCWKLATRTPCIVVSVDYSLSPEVQYPVALEQGYRALEWTYQHCAEFGGDPRRIAVGGESSGAALATSVAILARDRSGPDLCCQLLLQPVASYGYGPSEDKWLLYPEKMEWFWDQHCPSRDAAVLPINHPLDHLPPAFFILAEHDILTAGALQLIEKMEGATGRVYPGMIHGFCSLLPDFAPGDDALHEGINHLKEEFEVQA